LQHLLARAKWDANAVRDDLRRYVLDAFADPVPLYWRCTPTDWSPFFTSPVSSTTSTASAGRIENAQVEVFLTYAARRGHALIDRALYLPASWAGDEQRRRRVGVPAEVEFATKPALATAMITRAIEAGDEAYGADPNLRRTIRQHGLCGRGSKGHRDYSWAWIGAGARIRRPARSGQRRRRAASSADTPQQRHRRAGLHALLHPRPTSLATLVSGTGRNSLERSPNAVMQFRLVETFTFLGRVLPSNAWISIPRRQTQLVVEAIDLKLSVEFDVVSSDVVAIAQVEGEADLATIRNYVVEGLSAVLDAAAVLKGLALSLEMRSVVLPDGQRIGMDPRHPYIGRALSGLTQEQMLSALDVAPAQMHYVLRDMRLALAEPGTSAFWCYRAIDNVSRYWAPEDDPDDKKSKRWPAMYQALGDNRADVIRCMAMADRARHGHNEALTAADRDQALTTTWTLVGRFVRFLTTPASP
jgi:hypothetical protein